MNDSISGPDLLTLRPAFEESDRARLVQRVTQLEPPAPRRLDRRIPRDLETVVLKAIAKEPEKRYQSAAELAADLRHFLADRPIQARRSPILERFWLWCRRNPAVAELTGVIAASLLAGTAVSWNFALEAERRAEDAIREKNRADQKAGEARANAKRADEKAAEAGANSYALRMNLAQLAWERPLPNSLHEVSDVSRVLVLLEVDRHIPTGHKDLRGWEWYYQERLCHADLRTLTGHTGEVSNVAFSPDGRRLASASWDQTIKIWDTATGQELRILKGHTKGLLSVAFSPDGKQLASAGGETVKVWDMASGQVLRTLEGHSNWVSSVAFSPDGQRLASACQDGTVKVWDLAGGEGPRILEGHTREVHGVTFSPDSLRLASASQDRTVKI